jgi:hypothetical protein
MNEAADFKSAVSTYSTTQAVTTHSALLNKKAPLALSGEAIFWRRGPESNWANRICNPGHNRFATAPQKTVLETTYSKDKKGKHVLPFQVWSHRCNSKNMEREKSLELSTSTLARLRSTN